MDIAVINQMIVLFGLMAVGYGINKWGVLDASANSKLSAFLLKVTLPCAIIDSALSQKNSNVSVVLTVMAMAVGIFIAMPVLSKLITKIFNMEKTYQLMLNYSNLGFMGFPIIASLYGNKYVFYAAIFMMVFNVHIFTFGIMTLQGSAGGAKALLKKLCSPGIISALVAIVLVFFPIPCPDAVGTLFSSLGGITSPLAMIVIGSQLAEVNILDSFRTGKLYIMSFFKLIFYPAVVYIVLYLIVGKCIEMEVATVLVGLPVAANVTMLSSEYGGNVAIAAQGTCISTMLSVITVPLMMMVMGG